MTPDQILRGKRKIEALFAGAATPAVASSF
jgi:hypothetical protein